MRTERAGEASAAIPFVLFLVAFFAAWALRATVFYEIDQSISSPTARAVYSASLKFALWVVPAVLFAHYVRKARAASYLGLARWPDTATWLACIGASAVFFAAVCLFELGLGGKRLSAERLLSLSMPLLLLHHFVSPLLEEILFRGLVMKELMLRFPIAASGALCSLLFVGVHLPYWMAYGELNEGMLANVFGVFLFSNVACWLYARSRSIWPATLAHVVNNLLAALLVAVR